MLGRGLNRIGSAIRLPVLSFAILAGLGSAPAAAQSPSDLPPVFQSVDDNGVDVVAGTISQRMMTISIGPDGPGGLSYNFSTNAEAATVTRGFVTNQPVNNFYNVNIGSMTETFTKTGPTTFTQNQGRPSTLVYDTGTQRYTYTAASGMVAVFETYVPSGGQPPVAARIISITYPAGEVQNFAYPSPDASQARAIWTNLGYQMRFTSLGGGISEVVLFNMANVACDPAASSCTIPGTWPRLTASATSATDSLNRTAQIQGSAPSPVTLTFPGGRQMTYTFANNKVATASDGAGTWTYTYTPNGATSTTTITYPGVATHRILRWYTHNGAVITDQIGTPNPASYRMTVYVRDTQDRIERIVLPGNPTGGVIHFSYDARGNITQRRYESSTPGSPPDIITSATYAGSCDATNFRYCNQPSTTTDERGQVTSYNYHAQSGGPSLVTSPAVTGGTPQVQNTYQQSQASYLNGSGQPVQGSPVWRLQITAQCVSQSGCASPDQIATAFYYDPTQNLNPTLRSVNGAGTNSSWNMTYTSTGDLKTVNGPLGTSPSPDITRYYYDAMRQLTGEIGPDPDGPSGPLLHRARRMSYTGEGQLTTAERGTAACQTDTCMSTFQFLDASSIGYNAQGRVSGEAFAGTNVMQYSYTPAGLLECATLRMNPGVQPNACLPNAPGVFGPDRITHFTYNTFFDRTHATTAYGTSDAATEVTTYDARGLPATTADGNGNLTTFEYDNLQRLTRIRYPDAANGSVSSSTDFDQLTYETLPGRSSNLVGARQIRGSTISIGFGYDNLGRMTTKTFTNGEPTVTYGYDLLGRLLSASAPPQAITFTYNHLSQVLAETGPRGTTTSYYDAAGRRIAMSYPGGTYSLNYGRLVTGEMTTISAAGSPLITYTYDNLGRRTELQRGNTNPGRTTYAYDAASQLTLLQHYGSNSGLPELARTFGYNPARQIVSQSSMGNLSDQFAYTGYTNGSVTDLINGLNQVTSTGGSAVTYDAQGNLTSVGGGGPVYVYNAENRMTSAPGTTLTYDPLGRLYQATATSTSRFAYDGQNIIAEYNGSNTLQRRFVQGPGIDEPVVTGTSTPSYLLSDERGSIIGTANTAGTLTPMNSYDEYGITATTSAAPLLRYTGQPWLVAAGVYHFRARAYHPHLGRFMQPDPIGYSDGMNLYAYVSDDPVNRADPFGLCDAASASRGSSTSACVEQEIVITGTRIRFRWVDEHYNPGTFDRPTAPGRGGSQVSEPLFVSAPARSGRRQTRAADYCGAGGSAWVPDNISGADLRDACRRHDACYSTVGSSRDWCDARLAGRVFEACVRSGQDVRGCAGMGVIYQIGVRFFGLGPYRNAQRETIRQRGE